MNNNPINPRNSKHIRAGALLNAHTAEIEALIRLGVDKGLWSMDEMLAKLGEVIDEQQPQLDVDLN